MSRTCTVCAHPQRAEIDAALASGVSYRNITERFSVSTTAVQRHATTHIAQAIAQSQEARAETAALDVVAQLRAINGATLAILQEARKQHDGDLALKAIDRIQRQIELQAKLLGDLDERPQINVLVTPEWLTARTALLQALSPFTEARIAVSQALSRLEDAREQRGA